ncbi:MAG: xanthine dehydrogenase accessory protein XdhC [Betaproteobacteria bacterium]|nr:xanthine dehydrogenase accessory protein XdhC [Betaproteobacteria bacterium]
MQRLNDALFARLVQADGILVQVQSTRGSVPREAGAWMAVFRHGSPELLGTIGGGRLELDATAHARALLAAPDGPRSQSYALGPSLGQCCGGHVQLGFEPVGAGDIAALRQRLCADHLPVALFGGGHVGQALVTVLGQLPMDVHWIDSRDAPFPTDLPANVRCEHSLPVHQAVEDLAPQSSVLIMSFSHAEDLDIVAACLQRQRARADLRFIGLIGSKTKWATFRQRLEARGFSADELAQVTCPIGLPGIRDKRPEVIAVSVAAQLMGLPA